MVPALAWVPGVAASLGRALGCVVEHETKSTVNQLVYTVIFRFSQDQDGMTLMRIWNLVQMYAHRNESFPQGRPTLEPRRLAVSMGVKTKRGSAREDVPW